MKYENEQVGSWKGTSVGRYTSIWDDRYEDKQVHLFPVGSVCTYPTDEWKFNCVCYAEKGEILNRYTHERIYLWTGGAAER